MCSRAAINPGSKENSVERGQKLKAVVDKIEEGIITCEDFDRNIYNFDRTKINFELKVGDVIDIDAGIVKLDLEATKKRKKEIQDLTEGLWK
jgi:hypothetical protein